MSSELAPLRSVSASPRQRVSAQGTPGRLKNNDKTAATPRLDRSFIVPRKRENDFERYNKLYRCPPTPPPDVQYDRERSFVLDCNAVSNISQDYSRANPKLGSVIPPYDARCDHQVDHYFQFFGVSKTLARTGQNNPHESIGGRVHDRFNSAGAGFRYLSMRNKFGSGHSIEQIRGHELFLSDPTEIVNYHGKFGYRRNTPSLRRFPTIGTEKIPRNGVIPNGRFSVTANGRSYNFY